MGLIGQGGWPGAGGFAGMLVEIGACTCKVGYLEELAARKLVLPFWAQLHTITRRVSACPSHGSTKRRVFDGGGFDDYPAPS
jgi:hypothetical protein